MIPATPPGAANGAMLKLTTALLCVTTATAALAEPPPNPRDGSLIDAFQVLCNRQRPELHRLEGVAATMQMTLATDTTRPLPGDASIHVKEWHGRLNTGGFSLMGDEISTLKGIAGGCGVGGSVPDPEAFRTDVMRALGLATVTPTLGSGGSRVFTWHGANAAVVVTDFTLLGQLGVILQIQDRPGTTSPAAPPAPPQPQVAAT